VFYLADQVDGNATAVVRAKNRERHAWHKNNTSKSAATSQGPNALVSFRGYRATFDGGQGAHLPWGGKLYDVWWGGKWLRINIK
jgi:hypothetical protein